MRLGWGQGRNFAGQKYSKLESKSGPQNKKRETTTGDEEAKKEGGWEEDKKMKHKSQKEVNKPLCEQYNP